jgi:hypothetical protein
MLALVDFDALLAAWQLRDATGALPMPERRVHGGALAADDHKGEEACASDAPEFVVVLAMSARVCHEYAVTFSYARRFATRLTATLEQRPPAAERIHCEIALVLSMPDRATHALWRLWLHAAQAGAAAPFERLWLFSPDTRLADAIHRRLNPAPAYDAWRGARHHEHVRRWTSRSGARRLRSQPLPAMFTADWLRHDFCDVAPGTELHAIARELERSSDGVRPGLLSQIGITHGTTRGVGRLGWLPKSAPLHVVSPHDGVVLFHPPPKNALALPFDSEPPPGAFVRATLAPASIGAGAVTLGYGKGVTIARSRLPLGLVQTVSGASASEPGLIHLSLRSRELDDHTMLQKAPAGSAMGPSFMVRLGADGFADIPLRHDETTSSWWVRSRLLHASLPLPVPFPLHQLPAGVTRIAVAAMPCRGPGEGDVSARSTFERATIDVENAIAERTIGTGTAAGERAAVFAADGPIAPRSRIACTPVQALDLAELRGWTGLDRAQVEDLWRLPLLVPEKRR